MNVFDKYINNVKQNEELTEIINDLCKLHFSHCEDSLKRIFDIEFIKFLSWEIDTSLCPPASITMHYIGKDVITGEEKEYTKTFDWKNLLIKLEGYD
jgi:hypothetical protein